MCQVGPLQDLVRPPTPGGKNMPPKIKAIPYYNYAWESREFLREKLIGKTVTIEPEYERTIEGLPQSLLPFPSPTCSYLLCPRGNWRSSPEFTHGTIVIPRTPRLNLQFGLMWNILWTSELLHGSRSRDPYQPNEKMLWRMCA